MTQPNQSSSFRERVTQVRNRLVERLPAFRLGSQVGATAFCVDATIGEYAVLAGSTDPTAVLAAISALSAQLGVNLLADIIGDREPPPGLTTEEIAEAVQERLEQGEDLPAVRALLQEFGTLQLALETWRQAEDERWQQLVDELSRHPQLIAGQVTQDVVTALDPRLTTLEERTQHILELVEAQSRTQRFQPVGGRLLIFVSSIIGELREEREALEQALRQASLFMPWVFEHTTATSDPLPEAYLRRVRECDIFVLLVAGNISQPVIAEYETARDAGKPILAFIRRGDHSEEAAAFIQRVEQAGAFKYALFDDPDDLAELVVEAVLQELTDRHRDYWQAVSEGHIPPPNVDDLIQAYAGEVITHELFARWQERYTPLRAAVDLPRRYEARRRETDRSEGGTREYEDLRNALQDYQGIVLTGEPGAGKTTSLQRLALDHAAAIQQQDGNLIPVYLPLGGYTPARSLSDYLADQLKAATLETPEELQPAHAHRRLADHLDVLRRQGRLLIMLDGINELRQSDRAQALNEVRHFIQAALSDGCHVVVTSRTDDYAEIGRLPELTEVHVQELDDDNIEYFLRAHLDEDAGELISKLREDRRGLLELARNPYRLWMLQAVYTEYGELPANRALLFERMVDWLLERQKEISARTEPEAWFDADVIRAVLARLAYAMLADPEVFTVAPLDWVDEQLDGQVRVRGRRRRYDPERVLALARAARLTVETDPPSDRPNEAGTFRFTHQLLQEYFAAVHLNTLGPDHPDVLDCLRYDAWDETVVLLAGLTSELDRLVENLRRVEPFLAARCAGVCPDTLSSEIARCLVEDLTHLAYDIYSPWQKEAIAALGATCLSATLPVLLHLTQNQPVYVRQAVAEALGQLGVQEAIPTLLELLRDVEECVRQAAAEALGKLWTRDDVPELAELLRDDDWHVRRAAATALGSLGMQGAAPALLDRLQDDDWHVREAAAEALAKLGIQEAIPALVDRLGDKQWIVCQVAARALQKLGAREQVPALVRFLRDDDWHVRRAAIEVLGAVGAQEVTPILVEWLEDKSTVARQAAVWALGELGVREAIPNLMVLLHDPKGDIRESAAQAVGELGAHESIPELISLLSDVNGNVRQSAINALVKLKAHQSISRIVPLLHDQVATVRWCAAEALRELEAQSALPELRALLYDQNESVRWHVVGVIEGSGAREAVPDLVTLLHDVDGPTAERAADALVKLEAREVIPVAVTMLYDSKADKRGLAARILGELGARQAIPHLVVLLGDEEGIVRERAANALVKLEAREVIPDLLILLRDPREVVRAQAIHVLEGLGAQEAIPYLVALLRDSRKAECKRVAWALGELKAEVCMKPQLLLYIAEDTFAARQALRTLSIEAVLPVLRPLLSYPDGWVRKRLLRLHGEVRQKAGLPRESEATHGPYPGRAALRTVVTLADDVLALLPGWSLAARSKAHVLRRLGCPAALQALEATDAEVDLARVVEVELWHPETFGRRGQLALARGQFEEALEAFGEASRRDPHNVEWQYCLAFAHMGLGQPEQAISALEIALGRTELHEQVKVALQDLDLLARAQPDLPELGMVRGRILECKALLDKLAEEECARYGLR